MNQPELTAADEAALRQARELGVHCIPVPTPFAVGRVNCYLLEGEPLTLVDAGPRSERSLEVLDTGIRAAGFVPEDIELVTVTHQHIDHIGQVAEIADRAGAEVAALDLVVDRLARFAVGSEEEDQMAVRLMIRHGVPVEIAEALKEVTESFRSWGAPVRVTKPLPAGGIVTMGSREYEVLHRPGHSPSDTVFWDPGRGLALGGDHLLSHVSSNPLISKPLDGSGERTRALIDYEASLRLTREMPVELMLSGHGVPITDHATLIDKRLASQERRTMKIFGLLKDGGRSAHSIAEAIWGNIALTQAYLTLSEVIGHLDVLLDRGAVREISRDEHTFYEVAG